MTGPRWLALLILFAMLACLGGTVYLVREREVQVQVQGQIAPLPAPGPGQEPARVDVEVWFPELRLLMRPDGLRSYRDGISRARHQPARVGQGIRYRARVEPDGRYEVNVGFRSRQLPTRCTVGFLQERVVTRRLRNLRLEPDARGVLQATASDTQPFKARGQASTD